MMPGVLELTMTTIVTSIILLLIIGVTTWFGKRISVKMKAKKKSRWLVAHLIFIVLMFNGTIGILILILLTFTLTDSAELYAAHYFMQYFNWFLIIPGGMGALFTGVWLASRTAWGLTKYYWIICKWVIHSSAIVLGSVFLVIWLEVNIDGLFSTNINPLDNPDYLWNRQWLLIGFITSLAMSLFLVVISLTKPWGMRRKYRNEPVIETAVNKEI